MAQSCLWIGGRGICAQSVGEQAVGLSGLRDAADNSIATVMLCLIQSGISTAQ
jgi:hypothetical protein